MKRRLKTAMGTSHPRESDSQQQRKLPLSTPQLRNTFPTALSAKSSPPSPLRDIFKRHPAIFVGTMLAVLFVVRVVTFSRHTPRFYVLGNDSSGGKTSASGNTRGLRSVSTEQSYQAAVEEWGSPFVHLVHTRFMQEQGHLKDLAKARMLLFQVFCLPTMQKQSTQNFLWIIKVDPNMDIGLRRDLIKLVEPNQNFYLVGSNINFRINPETASGSWRDGAEERELAQRPIFTGNEKRLRLAMRLQNELTVLETRLDADDGLHLRFVELLQLHASRDFGINTTSIEQHNVPYQESSNAIPVKSEHATTLQWKYWCIRRHLEWHWTWQERKGKTALEDNFTDTWLIQEHQQFGRLISSQQDKMCVTPGLTAGFPVGTRGDRVPLIPHHVLYHDILHSSLSFPPDPKDQKGEKDLPSPASWLSCQSPGESSKQFNQSECITLLDDFMEEAIRSRTPTSAGMLNVLAAALDEQKAPAPKSKHLKQSNPQLPRQNGPWFNYALWKLLNDNFGISRMDVRHVQSYLQGTRLRDVARDNLDGQCTTGHSCKTTAKQDLQRIVDMLGEKH